MRAAVSPVSRIIEAGHSVEVIVVFFFFFSDVLYGLRVLYLWESLQFYFPHNLILYMHTNRRYWENFDACQFGLIITQTYYNTSPYTCVYTSRLGKSGMSCVHFYRCSFFTVYRPWYEYIPTEYYCVNETDAIISYLFVVEYNAFTVLQDHSGLLKKNVSKC